ncbi:MAG TPA: glycoside hydrolase domain-containing protein [Beijerinckiaceae bacterium]|jgi:hypothetical protein
MLTRRQFTAGLSATAFSFAADDKTFAQNAITEARVAIIDTPLDVMPYLHELKTRGVAVVGRYYARKLNVSATKRIAFNKTDGVPEAKAITNAGINILSIYQYMSGGSGKKFMYGRPDTGSDPKKEARADADAALQQARMVDQPKGTAIYFGVDYDCREGAKGPRGKPQIEFVMDYFRIINAIVGPHFRIGTYANGYVNKVLRSEGLVSLSWVSPSPSYDQTPEFLREGDWHLFQNQVDRRWFEKKQCPSGLDVDTNVQRPDADDIGFWGGEPVRRERVTAIFNERRFVVRSSPVYKAPDGREPIEKLRCRQNEKTKAWRWIDENRVVKYRNVRVIEDLGEWLGVDINDDGVPDGYCRATAFSKGLRDIPDYE